MADRRARLVLPRRLLTVMRLITDPVFRSAKLYSWVGRDGMFQPFNHTKADRYPRIFDQLCLMLGGKQDLRLLSFGCSTGEEVFSLARRLPNARIRGIDANPANIARARRAGAADPRLSFVVADSADGEPAEHYDAILCMAVFRDSRLNCGPESCARFLKFTDFETAVTGLARILKPGGLIAMRHSNFRFLDTAAGADFATVLNVPYPFEPSPIYGPDNRLLPGLIDADCVFRKRLAASQSDRADLAEPPRL